MSADPTSDAVERANLPVADLRRDLEEQLHELLAGRATNVSIDVDEQAGQINIRLDVEPSLFDSEDEPAETATNVAPVARDYGEWLRANSSNRDDPEPGDGILTDKVVDWSAVDGGR